MAITDRFCPRCGERTNNEGLCNQCKVAETRWFSCEPKVQSMQCPSCGAIKQGNVWTDTDRDRGDLAHDLARNSVHLHPDLKSPRIEVRVDNMSSNRSHAIVVVQGLLYHLPVKGKCDIEILWQKEQCDRCNRISGSYYEGVVQIRAQGRLPSPFESQMAVSIASDIEESLQMGGERLSFISDMTETRDGLDIVVGSQHIGLLIAQKVTAELGGRFTTHPKLIGEKDGKQLFRITYSVRLPRFQKRDIIKFQQRYAEVIQVESRNIRVFDFVDGKIKSVSEDKIDKLIGNARNAEDAMVAFSDGNTVGIIDPLSSATKESVVGPSLKLKPGDYVRILRDDDQLIILG